MIDYRSMIGTILDGRYLLISIIGKGGTSVVFNAFDRHAGTTVAIKLLNESAVPQNERATLRKQFANEIRTLSLLSHPNIVALKGSNLKKRPMYFVMEYADGHTLKEYIRRKKAIPQKELIDISCQMLSALNHMKEKGVVHCDIKPHNVIILPNKKIKLTDFGIARIGGKMPDLPPDKAVGSVHYVSPEQAKGGALDHRSDIYSLGIMLYEMATGQLPFNAEDPDIVAEMQAAAPPRRPRMINPDVSKGLEQIILKAIAKKPHLRFRDASDMATYLEILRKNPRSVFRLQERSPEGGAVVDKSKGQNLIKPLLIGAGLIAAIIVSLSAFSNCSSCSDSASANDNISQLSQIEQYTVKNEF